MNDQEKQLIQTIFAIGSKSTKYKIKDINMVPQVLQILGQEGLKALIEGLQNVKSEEEAIALYDGIMDQVSKTVKAKLGGILNYINKLNTIR